MRLFIVIIFISASLIIGCKKKDTSEEIKSPEEIKSLAKAVFTEEIKRDSDSIWFTYEVVESGIVHSFLGLENINQVHLSKVRFFQKNENDTEEEIVSKNDTVHRPTYLEKGLYKVKISVPFRQKDKMYRIVTDGNEVTFKW